VKGASKPKVEVSKIFSDALKDSSTLTVDLGVVVSEIVEVEVIISEVFPLLKLLDELFSTGSTSIVMDFSGRTVILDPVTYVRKKMLSKVC
ncbi:12442_t:CDS:1, partial [Funneliformis caledonium]